jgi:hypothetical protein
MAYRKFAKTTTVIGKNSQEGKPVYTGGAKVRFIGLPVNMDGSSALNGTALTFRGMFEGAPMFQVLDYSGSPLQIATRGVSVAHIDNYLDAAPILLPVKAPELFEGITVIIPVSNQIERDDRAIDIYFEPSNP